MSRMQSKLTQHKKKQIYLTNSLEKKTINIDQPENDWGIALASIDFKAVNIHLFTFKAAITNIVKINKIGHFSRKLWAVQNKVNIKDENVWFITIWYIKCTV